MADFFRFVSERTAPTHAQEWYDSIDHSEKVGSKHHIVPAMILRRFASPKGQLHVRDRSSGEGGLRSVDDLAVRDFNTVVTKDGRLDSSFESLLAVVEGAAATVIHAHLDATAFAKPRPFTGEERFKLDTFVALQAVRGMRQRRAFELITDYGMKLMNQQHLTADDIENLEIVPHPNEYLRMSGDLAERTQLALATRRLGLMTIDQPLLIIGDEAPLLLHYGPRIEDLDPNGYANVTGLGVDPKDIFHLQAPGGVGIGNADAIVVPLSPKAALFYGPPGTGGWFPPERYSGDEAKSAAQEINEAAIGRATDWVAANPDHPYFGSLKFPSPTPMLRVADGGSAISKRTNSDTTRRPIRRVRKSDVDDVPEPETESET